MKNQRKIFYVSLTVVASFVWHGLVTFFAYPVGGGEFHAIFAYSGGGQIDVAHHVFLVYMVSALAFACFMIITLGSPLHWSLIGAAAATPPLLKWWSVCSFPYAAALFHESAYPLLFPIVPVIMICSYGFTKWTTRSDSEDHPTCQLFY